MSEPISVDLPHNLGAAEARRRIAGGIGRLKDHIPGGAADVRSSWEGDRMSLQVTAMGQEVSARIDVQERLVRLEVLLPPMLGFFGKQIEGLLRRQGAELLEDKSKSGG
jgi:Putative polyhydroxyalkanoic acid system protein (PHA_gran_rgn)